VSFEESEGSLTAGMKSLGLHLGPFLEEGSLKILTAMPESAGVEQHLLRISDVIDDFDPRYIVVDSVSACSRMGSPHAAFDFKVRLLAMSRKQGITCLFTHQSGISDRDRRFNETGIDSLVDTLIGLRYQDEGGELRRQLHVVKSRGTAHSNRYHDMIISDNGLDFIPAVQSE
jgi:circadian clock protein KaiC